MRALVPSLACLAALVLVWLLFSPTTEVHYEVTVTVSDGKHVYSRSGVWSRTNTQYRILQSVIPGASDDVFQGEAIPLEIPGTGLLLMLPLGVDNDSDVAKSLVIDAFNLRRPEIGFTEQLQMAAALRRGERRRVPCDYESLPEIIAAGNLARVRGREASTGQNSTWRPQDYAPPSMPRGCFVFALMSDPRAIETFKVLSPGSGGRLGQTLLKVSRVDVAITDKPVTRRIAQYLPWLDDDFARANSMIVTAVAPDGGFKSTIGNGLPGEIGYLRRHR
jgi:hypothetical protein